MAFERAAVGDEMRMRTIRISSAMLVFRPAKTRLGCEVADRCWRKVRVVRRPCDLGRFDETHFGSVDHQASPLGKWPFHRSKRAEDLKTLPILSRRREKKTVGRTIRIPEPNVRALDYDGRTPRCGQLRTNSSRSDAGDIFRLSAVNRQTPGDAVRRVVCCVAGAGVDFD